MLGSVYETSPNAIEELLDYVADSGHNWCESTEAESCTDKLSMIIVYLHYRSLSSGRNWQAGCCTVACVYHIQSREREGERERERARERERVGAETGKAEVEAGKYMLICQQANAVMLQSRV